MEFSSSMPWLVSVPVRPGGFTALCPEDAAHDVVTDLAAISPFDVPESADGHDCVMADLQLTPDTQVPRRLGSGRAGYRRGAYLKGIGRTLLAGNWDRSSDAYHATGHMFASAAVREYLVTCYLRAKGGAHLIVPCTGLLVRRMSPELTAAIGRFEQRLPVRLAPMDRTLQGITVKPADFARFSNFAWGATHLSPVPPRIADIAFLLEYYAQDPDIRRAPLRCAPSSVAAALDAAVNRAVTSILDYPRFGVFWGSFHNNFALDGRFLDLELATICGSNFVGCFAGVTDASDSSATPRNCTLIGTELLDYLHHVRAMVDHLLLRLDYVARYCTETMTSEFLRQLRVEIDRRFDHTHVIRDERRQVDLLITAYVELGCKPSTIRRVLHSPWAARPTHERPGLGLVPCGSRVARAEPTRRAVLYRATALRGAASPRLDPEAEQINAWLLELDEMGDVDSLLDRIRDIEGRIARQVRALRQPVAEASGPC